VRTGLVIIGLVIVMVGAAVFLTVGLSPPQHTVSTITSSTFRASGAPQGTSDGSRAGIIPSAPQGSYFLFWIANASVGLSFYDSVGCHVFSNNTCQGTWTVYWPDTGSQGFYNSTKSLVCPCYAIPTNPHDYEVGINGYLFVTSPTTVPSLTWWSYVAVVFGSLILLLIGGLALFLGLFLKGRMFGGTPPPGTGEEGSPPEYSGGPGDEVEGDEYEVIGPKTGYWPDEAG
jgi:hypothetical protein